MIKNKNSSAAVLPAKDRSFSLGKIKHVSNLSASGASRIVSNQLSQMSNISSLERVFEEEFGAASSDKLKALVAKKVRTIEMGFDAKLAGMKPAVIKDCLEWLKE